MPRIAFCFHHSEASGASIWLQRFLLRCAELDRENCVAVFPSPSPLAEELVAAGIRCASLRVEQVSLAAAGARKKIRLIKNRVVAISDYAELFRREKIGLAYVNSSVQIAPMLAARRAGIPFVVHVHEAWRMGRADFLKRLIVRKMAAGAIFASRCGMKLFGGEPQPDSWLFSPNAADHTLLSAKTNRDQARAELGIGVAQHVFLFMGTLSQRKGVHDLLTGWKELSGEHADARLLIAGLEDESESNAVIRDFLARGQTAVKFLGFRKDTANLLAAADVFVLPSYGEAMPLTIVEAMMAGVPVIARNVGDIAWLLAEDRGTCFSGGGDAQLIDAMRAAIERPEELAMMATRAQEFAARELTWEKQCAQIFQFLTTIKRSH